LDNNPTPSLELELPIKTERSIIGEKKGRKKEIDLLFIGKGDDDKLKTIIIELFINKMTFKTGEKKSIQKSDTVDRDMASSTILNYDTIGMKIH
jgi:hypothetical protein